MKVAGGRGEERRWRTDEMEEKSPWRHSREMAG